MNDEITLTLTHQELDQLLEGLSERAESWEEIAESLRDSSSRISDRGLRIASPSAEGMSWYGGTASMWPGNTARDGDSGVQHERVPSMESLTAGLAATRIAVRYRNILDKILDQAQAGGWKPWRSQGCKNSNL